jgi:hypothetical protein
LEIVEIPDCEICGPFNIAKCFANKVSLAAGHKYLEGLTKRAGGGRLQDANTLESLILKLEFPQKRNIKKHQVVGKSTYMDSLIDAQDSSCGRV